MSFPIRSLVIVSGLLGLGLFSANALHGAESEDIYDPAQEFALFDQNRDGSVTSDELTQVLTALGNQVNAEDVSAMIGDADADGDGAVNLAEFTTMTEASRAPATDAEIKGSFAMFDRDGSDFVDLAEVKMFMTEIGDPLSEAEAQEMISEADTNSDQRISYAEFAAVMQP